MISPRLDPKLVQIDGTYYLRFNDPPRGRTAVSLHTRDRRRADAKAAPLLQGWIAGTYDPYTRKRMVDVGSVVEAFLASKKHSLRPTSLASLTEVLVPFMRDVGLYAPAEQVEVWLWARQSGGSPVSARTAHRRLIVLRQVAKYARGQGLPEPPLMGVAKPDVYEDAVRFLTRQQAADLFARLRGHRLELLVRMGLGTGARLSSLLALTPHDVHGGRVWFDRAKRGGYSIPLFPLAEETLQRLTPVHGRYFHLTVDAVCNSFAQLRDELGWPPSYTFHILRHTFASWLVQEGVSLYHVSRLLGHKRIQTTERYAHLDCHIAAKAYDVIRL